MHTENQSTGRSEVVSGPQPRTTQDPQAELRRVYMALLEKQARFDEFKQLLAEYPSGFGEVDTEPLEAADVRSRLNAKLAEWVGGAFSGLSTTQVQLWRGILVEERVNVALSPWKEANWY